MNHSRRLLLACIALKTAGVIGILAARPRLRRWGTRADETTRPLPGDDLVPGPTYAATRAITIAAPAAQVWPWLLQIGQNRGGFYTYDALENLVGLQIHSADRIHEEWQNLRAGEDYVTLDAGETMKLTIAVLEPPRAMVLRSGAPDETPQAPGDFFGREIAFTWCFALEPAGPTSCRLLIRSRLAWRPNIAASVVQALALEPVHFFMEEGTLRGIRDRAERRAGARASGPGCPSSV
jgi:hypothetical protein